MKRPIPQRVLNQFADNNDYFDSEERLIEAIEDYLLTDAHRAVLREHGLTLAKFLNCRYPMTLEPVMARIRTDWNNTLGFPSFLGDQTQDLRAMQQHIDTAFGGRPVRFE